MSSKKFLLKLALFLVGYIGGILAAQVPHDGKYSFFIGWGVASLTALIFLYLLDYYVTVHNEETKE